MSGLNQHEPHYREAIAIADAARGWFDGPGRAWIAALSPLQRVQVQSESLATTARLMGVMAWLLQRPDTKSAFRPLFEAELTAEHPLTGTPGGEIALASRALVERIKEQE